MEKLKLMIKLILLKIQILKIQLAIKLLRQKLTVPNLKGIIRVIVHHGGGNWSFDQINAHHKALWQYKSSLGFYMGYQKFIDFKGKLYIARRDNEMGAHTVDPKRPGYYNRTSIGICLQGNTEITPPTAEQIATLRKELDRYKAQGLKITMHSYFSATLCPGKYLKQHLEKYKGRNY